MKNSKKTLPLRGALTACALLMTLTLPGCALLPVKPDVGCEGTAAATDALVDALLALPQSPEADDVLIAGDLLIAQLDAACGRGRA